MSELHVLYANFSPICGSKTVHSVFMVCIIASLTMGKRREEITLECRKILNTIIIHVKVLRSGSGEQANKAFLIATFGNR